MNYLRDECISVDYVTMQTLTAVTACLKSKQLLLFVFALRHSSWVLVMSSACPSGCPLVADFDWRAFHLWWREMGCHPQTDNSRLPHHPRSNNTAPSPKDPAGLISLLIAAPYNVICRLHFHQWLQFLAAGICSPGVTYQPIYTANIS